MQGAPNLFSNSVTDSRAPMEQSGYLPRDAGDYRRANDGWQTSVAIERGAAGSP